MKDSSRNTSQEQEQEIGPETGLEKRFLSTLAWGCSGNRTRNDCTYSVAQERSRCSEQSCPGAPGQEGMDGQHRGGQSWNREWLGIGNMDKSL